jgi:phytoene dehydrogenase-like protein
VPRDIQWTPELVVDHVGRVRHSIEHLAPGFADTILVENIQTPADLESANANLVDGAINGGTAMIHQQLIFRPVPGTGRPETPIPGLFLASASAHPGGGVHGACGWNAARSALGAAGRSGAIRRQLNRTAWARLLKPQQG